MALTRSPLSKPPVYEVISLGSIRLLAIQDSSNSKISEVLGEYHGQFTLKGRNLDAIEERANRRLNETEARVQRKLELLPVDYSEDLSRRNPRYECSYFIFDPSSLRRREFDRFKMN
jgi:hypothetical protein